MRRIGVVTVGRSDFGILLPLLQRLRAEPEVDLRLYLGGGHWHSSQGHSWREIAEAGFSTDLAVLTDPPDDTGIGMMRSLAAHVQGFAALYEADRPDILIVLGDRYEMFAATQAALAFPIVIGHIHGGELSLGALDDRFRHGITKCAHLHFAATEDYARRIRQLGEEPWRVQICGAPSLDKLKGAALPDRAELEARFDLDLSQPPLLVTYHSVTEEWQQAEQQAQILVHVLDCQKRPIIVTAPNSDPGGAAIARVLRDWCQRRAHIWMVETFGALHYFGMMAQACAMVGNSSSGLIEAPSFGLPAVNIGRRQDGRVKGLNVIDTPMQPDRLNEALTQALSPAFRAGLQAMQNPYGDGCAAERITNTLLACALDGRLLTKGFVDWPDPLRGLAG